MPLMTPQDAARFLAISTKHLRKLTDAGEIRYVSIGNGAERETRRYSHEDLQAFIDARTKQEHPSPTPGQRASPKTFIVGIDFTARREARMQAKRRAKDTT